jgi:transcriptional regulator with XRE-family HTH domain
MLPVKMIGAGARPPQSRSEQAMTTRRRMTIKEVARAAGVSTQTVSRVLNNRPDVAFETLERVRQIIADTGYTPNMLARSLTQGRSHIIGVVAAGLDYFGPSRVLTGIEQQAADLGYAISLNLIHDPETRDVDELLSSLFSRQVDGIIWAIPEVGENRVWSHGKGPELPLPVAVGLGLFGTPSNGPCQPE